MESWVDGQPADVLSLKDRGLAYGDGLFETIAVRNGRPLLLERHLQRLETGCQRLALRVDMTVVSAELSAYARCQGDGVMKLIVTRGDSRRGYAADPRPPPDASCRAVLLLLIPLPMPSKACSCFPVQCACPSSLCLPVSSTSIAWNRCWPVLSGLIRGMPTA